VPVCQPPQVPGRRCLGLLSFLHLFILNDLWRFPCLDTTEFHPIYWQNYPAMSPLMGAEFSPYPEYPRKALCGDDMTDLLYGPLSTLFW
jgi:hypothetical protein